MTRSHSQCGGVVHQLIPVAEAALRYEPVERLERRTRHRRPRQGVALSSHPSLGPHRGEATRNVGASNYDLVP